MVSVECVQLKRGESGKSAVAPGHDRPSHNPTERNKDMRKQDRERGWSYESEEEDMG